MTQGPCEISWFSALCDDDYEFLGVPDPKLQSSWEHCRDIVLQADKSAFKAKKMGGPLPGNKMGMKNGRPGSMRENMALDTLDFNKKILHASWHPRENTIAVRLLILSA